MEAVRQAAGITHKTGYITQLKAGWHVCPIGRHAHIPPTSPGANAARALPVSGRLRPEFVCLIRLVRPSITVTSSPRRLYLLGVSCYCLACGVGPSYWRVGLALARLGENRRHWLEWPSGGKKPVLPRGEGRWVWGVASLARLNPNPQTSSPSSQRSGSECGHR